ncbi:glycoside hydrolase family 43 protein [Sphaerochaeta sp. PS]|uniref:glycoside hydrolase family 43 protein n=1 Tax=Sphaerochaeta sp. PS TaxID=3076336 RepID=UPI0028A31362|nr:glycoside hydrolase family 43 protein [Sphaerochaeta sp. PS]MDT4762786.1 glycoside hydrolase family 43 protein [Sphaerochaeta sp. PS]
MVTRNDIQIRDPFIFVVPETGTYYLFGTTDKNPWNQKGEGFDAYRSQDLESWEGPFRVFTPEPGFWGTHDFWAPEVHFFANRYYLLATFTSPSHTRGTQILVSDAILGPYLPVVNQAITPKAWECLDGTLHVDAKGRPWMVFCHEWVQANDGEIWAMQLDNELTHGVGEPLLLFKASEANWTRSLLRRDGSGLKDAHVTDGPFLYRQSDGKLTMLWSSLGEKGYAMGCAVSDNGLVTGPWRQIQQPLIDGDGGHGMVFCDLQGDLQVTYHTPNKTPFERFVFHQVHESPDGLVITTE